MTRVPALLRPALRALRANLVPGLCLQSFALGILLAYELSPATRVALDRIGQVKTEGGYAYSIAATAFFGGLVPYLFLIGRGRIPTGRRLAELVFYLAFWGFKGFEVDLLYRSQAAWFGHERTFSVIFAKTLIDQILYGPLWAVPTQTLFFLWKDSGFSVERARKALRQEGLLDRLLVVLGSNWLVWIPAVAIIYSLPAALQLPLSNLVLVFWTLILTFVSRSESA